MQYFERLPVEIIEKVVLLLDVKSLVSLSSVNKYFREFINNNWIIWKHQCSVFGIPKANVALSTWKVN